MANNTTRLAASLTSTGEQRARRYRNESNVKFDLSQLIDALGYGPVENEHTIRGGSIDIYIPHHRVIIETKARGLADDPHKPQAVDRESPREQRWSPSFRQLSGQIKVKSGFIGQAASCCDEVGQSPGLGAAPTLYASSGVWSPSDECGRRLL